jgi:hypothetical protein
MTGRLHALSAATWWPGRDLSAPASWPSEPRRRDPCAGATPRVQNARWGCQCVRGELVGLSCQVSASTDWKILHTVGADPEPRRNGPTWAQFLTNQTEALLARTLLFTSIRSGSTASKSSAVGRDTPDTSVISTLDTPARTNSRTCARRTSRCSVLSERTSDFSTCCGPGATTPQHDPRAGGRRARRSAGGPQPGRPRGSSRWGCHDDASPLRAATQGRARASDGRHTSGLCFPGRSSHCTSMPAALQASKTSRCCW